MHNEKLNITSLVLSLVPSVSVIASDSVCK